MSRWKFELLDFKIGFCGGISLASVNSSTLESRYRPNLYFAGEVLDIDGITGGFNFQAAWTTAYTAAQAIIKI